nr:zinc finger, RING/FYVE/PHD-type [Tanacetum cinerariifolium]
MGEVMKPIEDEEELEYEEEEDEEEYDYEVSLPKVINWVDENGKSVYGVEMINYNENKNKMKEFIRGELQVCPICSQSWTSNGSHRICCLPCGHIYGMSCIKKWLQQVVQNSSRKCPQCNKLCTLKDVRVLYATHLQAASCHKISTTRFPFTEKGFKAFKQYVLRLEADACVRRSDALKLRGYVWAQHIDLLNRAADVLDSLNDVLRQRDNALERCADALEWRADALERRAESLEQHACVLELRAESLERRADALEQQAYALDRRADALIRRAKAYKACMNFFEQRYKEHIGHVGTTERILPSTGLILLCSASQKHNNLSTS